MLASDKTGTRERIAKLCADHRAAGRTVGFTSGVFDLLHAGHAAYLADAKSKVDVLVVGVNDDASVKSYKGDKRPVVPQEQRLALIASLGAVDHAFLFEERRNRANLEALRPHFYIKAGDYSAKDLTSADLLKEWGGEVMLLPFVPGLSSTNVIGRILEVYGEEEVARRGVSLEGKKLDPGPVVFLDRDGTINVEVEYLHEPEKFEPLPGAIEGMKALADAGCRLAVVTTQAGIGLGYFSKEDFYKVNKRLLSACGKAGVALGRVYFCPHGKDEACRCRKPETALLERGAQELAADPAKSFMIGDKTSDLLAGKRMGYRTILVTTGHAGRDGECDVTPDFTCGSLLEAAAWITEALGKN